jgi:cation:H+ antiporter
MLWITFVATAVLIVTSGTILTVYAEKLGEKLNISGAFVGLIILSVVSSLPELGTTFSVVNYLGKPDMAAGNLFGSNTFNMLILSIFDFALGSASIYALSTAPHQKSILLAFLMTVVSMAAIYSSGFGVLGGYAIDTGLLAFLYIFGVYILYLDERDSVTAGPIGGGEVPWKEIAVVAGSSAVVVASGYWLAGISGDIEKATGWGESFVGTIFLAVTTSLPELVITLASIRLKAYDMAIANTVGSCFFNLIIFSIVDPFYAGPIFMDISISNFHLAGASLVMLLLVSASLFVGKQPGILSRLTAATKYLLIIIYLAGSWLVFSS